MIEQSYHNLKRAYCPENFASDSIIILDDKKQESVIRIGDMVKMKYSKSSMKSFAKMAKNMTK